MCIRDRIYTPDPNSSNTETLTYLVSDGTTETQSTLQITVDAVDDAPESRMDSLSTAEDTPLNLSERFAELLMDATDVDGEPLTLVESSFSEPVNGTITVDNVTGDLIYTPDPNSFHTETLTYRVSDGMTETQSTLQITCLLYTSPSPRDATLSRMPSSA